MSCFANGSAVALYICLEDVNGEISATVPNFLPVRFVSEGFAPETSQIDSEEIRPDRQRPVSRQGTYSVNGNIAAELAHGSQDTLIEAALQGTWAVKATKTAITLSAAAADDSFNDSANGFVTAGFEVGDVITVSGFTGAVANNATWKIATVAAGKITVTNPDGTPATTIVDDAAGESVTIATVDQVLLIGTTRRSFAVLERHTDKNIDYIYRGCEVGGLNLSVPLNGKVGLSFPMLGKEAEPYVVPGGATFAARSTSDIMVTTEGSLLENAVAIAYATELNLALENGMQANFALFQRAAYCLSNGTAVVSGDLSFYLIDATLYSKFLDETSTSLKVKLTDGTEHYTFHLPNVLYTQGSKETANPNAIIPQLTYSAGYSDAIASTLRILRSSAP